MPVRGLQVLVVVLHVHRVAGAAVAGHLQRVGRRIVVGQRAGALDPLERLIEFPAQAEIERDVRPDFPFVLHERRDRPMPGAGLLDHFEITLDGVGPIEQERRERVRNAGQRPGFGRRAGARRGERKAAARAAGVLRLQEDVAVLPPLAADLDRCVRTSFVTEVATLNVCSERSHGWLAENPRTGSE